MKELYFIITTKIHFLPVHQKYFQCLLNLEFQKTKINDAKFLYVLKLKTFSYVSTLRVKVRKVNKFPTHIIWFLFSSAWVSWKDYVEVKLVISIIVKGPFRDKLWQSHAQQLGEILVACPNTPTLPNHVHPLDFYKNKLIVVRYVKVKKNLLHTEKKRRKNNEPGPGTSPCLTLLFVQRLVVETNTEPDM